MLPAKSHYSITKHFESNQVRTRLPYKVFLWRFLLVGQELSDIVLSVYAVSLVYAVRQHYHNVVHASQRFKKRSYRGLGVSPERKAPPFRRDAYISHQNLQSLANEARSSFGRSILTSAWRRFRLCRHSATMAFDRSHSMALTTVTNETVR